MKIKLTTCVENDINLELQIYNFNIFSHVFQV